jgi:hypothetical protein
LAAVPKVIPVPASKLEVVAGAGAMTAGGVTISSLTLTSTGAERAFKLAAGVSVVVVTDMDIKKSNPDEASGADAGGSETVGSGSAGVGGSIVVVEDIRKSNPEEVGGST